MLCRKKMPTWLPTVCRFDSLRLFFAPQSESSLAMDASASHHADSTSMVSGASKYLANLPSRGFLSSTFVSSNPGGMQVYLCVHDTAPPDEQDIKTNQENILIRSLMLKNNSLKDAKGVAATEPSRKRVAERISDNRGKKTQAQINSTQEGASSSTVSAKDLHSLTVDRLRALLKERGLSLKGKKDELIARLKGVDS